MSPWTYCEGEPDLHLGLCENLYTEMTIGIQSIPHSATNILRSTVSLLNKIKNK